jgi:SpoVK/Ycf46/Vps4 family AAA+-type ATPase
MDFNAILNAGIILSLLTYIGYQLKSIPEFILNWIKRKITFSVTIDEGDELYIYIERWLRDCHQKNYRNIEASLNPSKLGDLTNIDERNAYYQSPEADKLYIWQYDDEFIISHGGKRILLSKGREKLEGAKDLKNAFLNRYTLRGFWAKHQILDLLQTIIDYNQKFKSIKVPTIWTNAEWNDWQHSGKVTTKDFSNIFFDGKEELIDDLNLFKDNAEWYKKRGITYKRGYLLWGKPGNGKTATIQAIAKHLGRDIYYLSLKDLEKDSQLTRLFSGLGDNSILVIEDIDAQISGRNVDSPLSFSIILNCLDGLLSHWGLITIMTTNHPEQLDPALIRRGRIDKSVKISNPSRIEVENYLKNFYECDDISLEDYVDGCLPMVKIQDLCLLNPLNLDRVKKKIISENKIISYEEVTKDYWGEEVF